MKETRSNLAREAFSQQKRKKANMAESGRKKQEALHSRLQIRRLKTWIESKDARDYGKGSLRRKHAKRNGTARALAAGSTGRALIRANRPQVALQRYYSVCHRLLQLLHGKELWLAQTRHDLMACQVRGLCQALRDQRQKRSQASTRRLLCARAGTAASRQLERSPSRAASHLQGNSYDGCTDESPAYGIGEPSGSRVRG